MELRNKLEGVYASSENNETVLILQNARQIPNSSVKGEVVLISTRSSDDGQRSPWEHYYDETAGEPADNYKVENGDFTFDLQQDKSAEPEFAIVLESGDEKAIFSEPEGTPCINYKDEDFKQIKSGEDLSGFIEDISGEWRSEDGNQVFEFGDKGVRLTENISEYGYFYYLPDDKVLLDFSDGRTSLININKEKDSVTFEYNNQVFSQVLDDEAAASITDATAYYEGEPPANNDAAYYGEEEGGESEAYEVFNENDPADTTGETETNIFHQNQE